MNRRELLLSLISFLGLAGSQILVSCQSAETDNTGTDDLTAVSSSNGHTHQFTITAEELASPVAISRQDSSGGGHTHLVALTSVQVAAIAAGTSVGVTSGSSSGHTHTYTFQIS
jgi:hypothetical protein